MIENTCEYENKMTIQTVKNDLRELRRLAGLIPLYENIIKKYQKRISVLKKIHSDSSDSEIRRLEDICSSFKIKELYERKNLLSEKYNPYIEKLMPFDRSIIIYYIYSVSIDKIAQDVEHSEFVVRKRIERACGKISNMTTD